MPRPASGSVEVRKLRDGTSSVRARFRHRGERYPIVFGRDVDGWTEARGRRELQMILAQLSAGVPVEQVLARYESEQAHDEDEYATGITMHEYASDWLERRRVGEIGEGPLGESTYEDYLWRLKKYILPTLGQTPVARINGVDCRRFRGKLFKDSEALKKIAAAGGRAEDEKGRLRRPLSPRSIQMMMRLLGQILAQAVKNKVRDDNPARDSDLKIRVPKPARTFLEIDQLVVLLDAAHYLQTSPRSSKRTKLTREQAAEIRARLKQERLSTPSGMSMG